MWDSVCRLVIAPDIKYLKREVETVKVAMECKASKKLKTFAKRPDKYIPVTDRAYKRNRTTSCEKQAKLLSPYGLVNGKCCGP